MLAFFVVSACVCVFRIFFLVIRTATKLDSSLPVGECWRRLFWEMERGFLHRIVMGVF